MGAGGLRTTAGKRIDFLPVKMKLKCRHRQCEPPPGGQRLERLGHHGQADFLVLGAVLPQEGLQIGKPTATGQQVGVDSFFGGQSNLGALLQKKSGNRPFIEGDRVHERRPA